MKNRLTTMILAIILCAAVLMSLSCKGTSQNTTSSNNAASNTAVNINQNISVQDGESDTTLDIKCDVSNPNRQQEVFNKIEKDIQKEPILKYEYEDGKFDFDVVDESGKLVVYIWGRVYTAPEDKVDALNKTFKKLVKKGCVSKVVFGEPTGDKTLAPRGFEYNLCESPNGVCADGTCKQGCLLLKPEDNTNMSTNANANR